MRLGDLLLKEGLVTREQIDKALLEGKQNGTRLGYALVKLGFVQETDITKMLARQFRMPAVDLSRFEVDPRIAKLIPADLATKHLVLPLKRDGRTLTVAMADPTNLGVIDDLKFITRYDIFPVIAGEYTLRNAVEKYYESSDAALQTLLDTVRWKKQTAHAYPLSGRIVTEDGHAYTGRFDTSNKKRRYRCRERYEYSRPGREGGAPCSHREVAADKIERAVWDALSNLLKQGREAFAPFAIAQFTRDGYDEPPAEPLDRVGARAPLPLPALEVQRMKLRRQRAEGDIRRLVADRLESFLAEVRP